MFHAMLRGRDTATWICHILIFGEKVTKLWGGCLYPRQQAAAADSDRWAKPVHGVGIQQLARRQVHHQAMLSQKICTQNGQLHVGEKKCPAKPAAIKGEA
jgi:hypothetical protein